MDKIATSGQVDAFLTTMHRLCMEAKAGVTTTPSVMFRNRMYHAEYGRLYQATRSGDKWSIVPSA